jgi:SNF2 family DNA or RNA helicase
LQAAKAARAFRRKTVVVCPAHVRGVWERPPEFDDQGGEIAKWWPKATVHAPYGVKPSSLPRGAEVVVTHYDIIHAWVEELLDWSNGDLTIVFDEAHVLLNPNSRRSKACREIAHAALGRIALTGTPPTDRVRDLYNIVDTISPGRFGSFFNFAARYCDAKKKDVPGPDNTIKTVWDFDGKSNMKELRARLDWFCLRRTKREVLDELPALQRQVIDVRVPPKNRLAMTARLVNDKRRMRMALDAAADGKHKHVIGLVTDHLNAGARVVVGTYRRAVCEKMADALSNVAPTAFVHGGIPLTRRPKIINKLRKTKGPCCLVANIDCASTGIDLTFAHVVVMGELVWEPRDLVQFEARSHRFGQEESVLVQYIIARGTGDELILQAVINKLDSFLDLVETDEGDGLKETLEGEKDEGLTRLAAALKKMGKKAKKS